MPVPTEREAIQQVIARETLFQVEDRVIRGEKDPRFC